LSAEQKQAARDRIALNGNGDGGQREWNWNQVKECFIDPQIWLFFSFNVSADENATRRGVHLFSDHSHHSQRQPGHFRTPGVRADSGSFKSLSQYFLDSYVSFGFTNLESILFALPNSAMALVWFLFVALTIQKFPSARFPLMTFSVLPPFIGLLSIGLLSDSTDKWVKWGLYNMTSTFTVPTFLGTS
jgi:hypothetical protein